MLHGMVVSLNGQRYNCPQRDDITTEKYQKIYTLWGDEFAKEPTKRDYVKLFSILVDADFDKMKASVDNEEAIWIAIRWFFVDYEPSRVFTFRDERFHVKKYSSLPIGHTLTIQQRMDQCRFIQENIAYALACMIQSRAGELDDENIAELEKEILQMPACQTVAVGFFLLSQVMNFGKDFMKGWPRPLANLMKNLRDTLLS